MRPILLACLPVCLLGAALPAHAERFKCGHVGGSLTFSGGVSGPGYALTIGGAGNTTLATTASSFGALIKNDTGTLNPPPAPAVAAPAPGPELAPVA